MDCELFVLLLFFCGHMVTTVTVTIFTARMQILRLESTRIKARRGKD